MKDDRAYLLHIRDAIERVLQYTRDGEQTFMSDTKTQDVVVRNVEVIGEASKNLSDVVRDLPVLKTKVETLLQYRAAP